MLNNVFKIAHYSYEQTTCICFWNKLYFSTTIFLPPFFSLQFNDTATNVSCFGQGMFVQANLRNKKVNMPHTFLFMLDFQHTLSVKRNLSLL